MTTITSNGRYAMVMRDDGVMDILVLPRPPYCSVSEVTESLNRLPEGFGLFLDRGADHFRILKIDDATLPNLGDNIVGQIDALSRPLDDRGGELLQAKCDNTQEHNAEPAVSDDLVFVIHRRHRSRSRGEAVARSYTDRAGTA